MTVRIISTGIRKKLTKGAVQYAGNVGSFYVRKDDLKVAGCTSAPETLYQIITDELPEGWEVLAEEQQTISFEL